LIIILVAFFATRNLSLIPGRFESLMEGLVSFQLGQIEEIAGEKKGRVFFPVIATFFIFILIGNWFALLPWVKAIGTTTDYGVEIFHYISEYEEKDDGGFSKKEFLAWDVDEVGPFGVVGLGSTDAFKFNVEE